MSERLGDDEYLLRVEQLANEVRDHALDEGWLTYASDAEHERRVVLAR